MSLRPAIPVLILPLLLMLTSCGELPKGDYPCLVATDRFDTFNEAYVFAPGGDKQPVLDRAADAETACVAEREER